MVVGGSRGDDGSTVEVWVLGMDASICPVVVSLGGIVCSAREGSWNGSVGFDGPSISCSGGDRIPKCCCIYLRKVVCWVWVAISWSWCARMASICWVKMLWVAVNVCKVWHRPLNFKMDTAILDSDGWGSDVAGTTGGVLEVAGGAEGHCRYLNRSCRGHCRGRCSDVRRYLNRLWLLWMLWLWYLWMLWSSWGSWLCIIGRHTSPFFESEYLSPNASALKLRLRRIPQVL